MMNDTTCQAFLNELEKISSSELQQRAESLWRAKSMVADKASSLPSTQRAAALWRERSAPAAQKGGKVIKKGLGLLARLK